MQVGICYNLSRHWYTGWHFKLCMKFSCLLKLWLLGAVTTCTRCSLDESNNERKSNFSSRQEGLDSN